MYFHSFLQMEVCRLVLCEWTPFSLGAWRTWDWPDMDDGKNQSGTEVTRIPTATRM